MERAVDTRPDRPAVFEAGHDGGECAACGFGLEAGDILTWTEPVGGELVHLLCVEDDEHAARARAARQRIARARARYSEERMWGGE